MTISRKLRGIRDPMPAGYVLGRVKGIGPPQMIKMPLSTITPAGSANIQPGSKELTALANLSSTGLVVRTAAATYTTRSVTGGTGITIGNGDGVSGNVTVTLANTAVTPGSYTNTDLTVDAQGRITAAANGSSGGGGSVTTTGSPASGNLAKFSGASSITNGDLSGDVTTSGTLVATIAANAVTPAKLAFKGASVSKSANQTTANYTAGAVIAFDTEDFDDGGWHDNVTNNSRLTTPAGITRAEFYINLVIDDLTTTDHLDLRLYKNGSPYRILMSRQGRTNTFTAISASSGPVVVSPTDYYEAHLQVSADTSITLYATTEGGCHFGVKALG